MVKIRLMRIGAKKRPFYRVVAVNEQAKRTGGYLELLGTYNPLTTPKDIKLKQDRIDHWVKQGAQMTNGFLRIIGKAKQRLPQKAKKLKKEAVTSPSTAESAPTETKPVADTTKTEVVEETIKPVEEADVKNSPEEKPNEGSA